MNDKIKPHHLERKAVLLCPAVFAAPGTAQS